MRQPEEKRKNHTGGETKTIPVLYKKKESCCGCTACYAVCPQKAIFMQADEEGFLYPAVIAEKCIGCHLCLKVCVFKKHQKEKGYF